MSGLGTLLSILRDERADRVVFAPNDHAYAFDGDRTWPVGFERVSGGTILAAVAELLSQDELQAIPESRPRIVRHAHDGVQYVIEVARGGAGIRLAVRLGKPSLKRESVRERIAPSAAGDDLLAGLEGLEGFDARAAREPSFAPAGLPLIDAVGEPLPMGDLFDEGAAVPPPRPARRADKRTVRVALDDEGKPVDDDALGLELEAIVRPSPTMTAKPPEPNEHSRLTKEVERPTLGGARRSVHQTHVISPAGQPAPTAVIKGDPDGAHITFLLAPAGFTLDTGRGVPVTFRAEDAAVRGEIFVAPSMTLKIIQGPTPSIVSYYRFLD